MKGALLGAAKVAVISNTRRLFVRSLGGGGVDGKVVVERLEGGESLRERGQRQIRRNKASSFVESRSPTSFPTTLN